MNYLRIDIWKTKWRSPAMILTAGACKRLFTILSACVVFLGMHLSASEAQPLPGNATGVHAPYASETIQEYGQNDFSNSAAADSHTAEDMDLIRRYNQELPEDNPPLPPASEEPMGQSSPLLTRIVPPQGPQPTALRLFRLIPPTIFENTVEGLDENEKQVLADNGRTGPWVLTSLTDDDLEFTSSVPHSNTKVRMHLYHANNGDIFIACGVQSGESCAMELWRRDAGGRIIPVPIPDEPGISEFLAAGRFLPEDYEVSMLICLDTDSARLKAVPLLWMPTGLGSLPLNYDVYYQWDGDAFSKKALPRAP